MSNVIEDILEAFRKDLRRQASWADAHTEGGMHLSKDQAAQAIKDYYIGLLPEEHNRDHRIFDDSRIEAYADGFDRAIQLMEAKIRGEK